MRRRQLARARSPAPPPTGARRRGFARALYGQLPPTAAHRSERGPRWSGSRRRTCRRSIDALTHPPTRTWCVAGASTARKRSVCWARSSCHPIAPAARRHRRPCLFDAEPGSADHARRTCRTRRTPSFGWATLAWRATVTICRPSRCSTPSSAAVLPAAWPEPAATRRAHLSRQQPFRGPARRRTVRGETCVGLLRRRRSRAPRFAARSTRLREELVPAAEVEQAKRSLLGAELQRFQSIFGTGVSDRTGGPRRRSRAPLRSQTAGDRGGRTRRRYGSWLAAICIPSAWWQSWPGRPTSCSHSSQSDMHAGTPTVVRSNRYRRGRSRGPNPISEGR